VVATGAAVDEVAAFAAFQLGVVAGPAFNAIGAGAAFDFVVALIAQECVFARPAILVVAALFA
jgi:hypothetical protein